MLHLILLLKSVAHWCPLRGHVNAAATRRHSLNKYQVDTQLDKKQVFINRKYYNQ